MSYDTDWHYVGETGEPAFENDWQKYLSYDAPKFKKGADGVVRIQGVLSSLMNGDDNAFTLPIGYRPTDNLEFAQVNNGSDIEIVSINLSGRVKISGAKSTSVSFCLNISYYVGDTEYPGTDGEDGATGAIGATGATGATGAGFDTYDSTVTYGINAIVASMGVAWLSQKDNNTGVTPGTNEANWKEAFRILTPYDEYSGGSANSNPTNIISGGTV